MTILRSRTVTSETTLVAHPSVARALSDWEARVAEALEKGRQQGLAEAEARIAAAERRAQQAEHSAEAKQQQRQQEFLARFEPALKAITQAATHLDPLEKQLIQESEAECVRLAIVLAATILRRELHINPAWMDAVVQRAMAEIPDRRTITIRMHPADAASLQERLRELVPSIPGLEQVAVDADDTLARGACILASRGTRLDTSLSGCWERLAGTLLDAAPTSDVNIAVWPGDQGTGDAGGNSP
jgi:flagellar biosynthesis/type III secretory pathway protein FliH